MDNQLGVFLIRESESSGQKSWALSVLDQNDRNERVTSHYRINRSNSGSLFIDTKKRFLSFDALVEYYSS
jgi:hypothetical protein